jgi:stress-induced morphogen
MKEIVIDVSDDGQIQIETRGFAGKSCVEESQFIKDVLGSELLAKKPG